MQIYVLVIPGNADSDRWPQAFARRAMRTSQEGGEVWISKRMLSARPLADWSWTEGEDPLLKWRDIPDFFRRFTFDGDVGGTDGFLRVARVPANQSLLDAISEVDSPGKVTTLQ
jgi:hypothetical protein